MAHYTTPTNIGLFLVSTLSAYDLGYIDLPELAIRLRSSFESIDGLEHYRGHSSTGMTLKSWRLSRPVTSPLWIVATWQPA